MPPTPLQAPQAESSKRGHIFTDGFSLIQLDPLFLKALTVRLQDKSIMGVRTLHDDPHHRIVHRVGVFTNFDDNARHVHADGLGTPEA